jgi:hypothetical protein
VSGGFGPIYDHGQHSHSTYHSLQVSASKTSLRYGLGFQASYTFSKSLDDTSAVLGGFVSSAFRHGAAIFAPEPVQYRRGEGPVDLRHRRTRFRSTPCAKFG